MSSTVTVVVVASGALTSTPYSFSIAIEPLLPASSVASTVTVTLVSAAKSAPGTVTLKLPSASKVPGNVLPFTSTVTTSPSVNSPSTLPVITTSAADSALLRTPSSAMSSTVTVVVFSSGALTSTPYSFSIAIEPLLPASSVASTVTVTLV